MKDEKTRLVFRMCVKYTLSISMKYFVASQALDNWYTDDETGQLTICLYVCIFSTLLTPCARPVSKIHRSYGCI